MSTLFATAVLVAFAATLVAAAHEPKDAEGNRVTRSRQTIQGNLVNMVTGKVYQ